MAVDLWSEVTVERADKFEIIAEGDGADKMPKDSTNLLVLGCQKAFDAAQKEMPTLRYSVKSNIPYARGLGSSSAAIVAGIIAGLVLAGHRLPCWGSEALLQIAAGIEVGRRFSRVYSSMYEASCVHPVSDLGLIIGFFRDTPIMFRRLFTEASRLVFTTAHDGKPNASLVLLVCSWSCLFLISLAKLRMPAVS